MSNIDKQALREAAENALPAMKRLLMMPNDELFDEALLNVDGDVDAANIFNLLAGPETMLALLDELEALQSFRTAYMEWSDKTDWVQTDKRLDVIKPWGKHRADVLKLYIDHLESKLEATEEQRANWFQMAQKLGEDLDAAEKRVAGLEAKLAKPVLLPKTNGYWTEQEKAYEEAITFAKRQVRLAGFRCEGDE
ncbi:ead/Ea22-like family protein [Citrobacter sp. CK196]|uniref:ead/Ea22-like family protein n=1 Tax=Citrobacter sp. CK196 TaxID=2985105 RepID=UPI002574E74E|nr:ead/Ea22-like family protein [Citrobacter sp. CK196]MDM2987202.1 ead/Ea22-like family protein [Citrobacter sp. CK196]